MSHFYQPAVNYRGAKERFAASRQSFVEPAGGPPESGLVDPNVRVAFGYLALSKKVELWREEGRVDPKTALYLTGAFLTLAAVSLSCVPSSAVEIGATATPDLQAAGGECSVYRFPGVSQDHAEPLISAARQAALDQGLIKSDEKNIDCRISVRPAITGEEEESLITSFLKRTDEGFRKWILREEEGKPILDSVLEEEPEASEVKGEVGMYIHRILPGETLFGVVNAYNQQFGANHTVEYIAELNQIENPDLIRVGDVVKFPPNPQLVSEIGRGGPENDIFQFENEGLSSFRPTFKLNEKAVMLVGYTEAGKAKVVSLTEAGLNISEAEPQQLEPINGENTSWLVVGEGVSDWDRARLAEGGWTEEEITQFDNGGWLSEERKVLERVAQVINQATEKGFWGYPREHRGAIPIFRTPFKLWQEQENWRNNLGFYPGDGKSGIPRGVYLLCWPELNNLEWWMAITHEFGHAFGLEHQGKPNAGTVGVMVLMELAGMESNLEKAWEIQHSPEQLEALKALAAEHPLIKREAVSAEEPPAIARPEMTPAVSGEGRIIYVVNRPPVLQQTHNLTCEATSAAMVARAFGIDLSEEDFIARIPPAEDNNPNHGYVGNINGPYGRLPPEGYGVYAEPVAAALQKAGLEAEVVYGLSLEELRQHIEDGDLAILWITYNCWQRAPDGEKLIPVEVELGGEKVKVIRFEHTVVATGVKLKNGDIVGFVANDPFDGAPDYYPKQELETCFEHLGRMAVIVKGRL